ncbi:MAG: transposase [Cytophagaceae bacterium]|jgi:IS1 family transposase|nr:transposase [Cytophagaceae bacterium]
MKAGLAGNTIQRYYCRHCKRHQQEAYQYNGCKAYIENRIVELNNEGCGIRSISRVLHISPGKVLSSIKGVYKKQKNLKKAIVRGREYELDEMKTFIKRKKNKYWIVYAIDKLTREPIDFTIGKRSKKTLRRIVDTLVMAGAKKIYTDKLKLYTYIIPKELHVRSQYKINRIERKNLSIRTHLKRLSRRTICFSRSKEMLEASIGVYFGRNSCSFI